MNRTMVVYLLQRNLECVSADLRYFGVDALPHLDVAVRHTDGSVCVMDGYRNGEVPGVACKKYHFTAVFL